MPLRAVLFDAGNTLLYVNREEIRRVLARRGHALDPGRLVEAELKIRQRLDDPELVARSTDGSRWDRLYGGILEELGMPPEALEDLRAYHERRNLWDTVPAEVPRVLERLRGRYRLGVISNSNGTVAGVLARLGLAAYFETVVDSHLEGVEKPDPRIFRIALERMGLAPAEAIYVGDIYHIDVVGARAAGMDAILLDPGGLHLDKDCRRIADLAGLEEVL
ncbi:MAG: HAD family hydrolase [Planctomycetes bacterium]|nr:HAD family hydrolase [Planctomycetota bacterium]